MVSALTGVARAATATTEARTTEVGRKRWDMIIRSFLKYHYS
jgi:hypothetical protein